jgi:hypothetical protein
VSKTELFDAEEKRAMVVYAGIMVLGLIAGFVLADIDVIGWLAGLVKNLLMFVAGIIALGVAVIVLYYTFTSKVANKLPYIAIAGVIVLGAFWLMGFFEGIVEKLNPFNWFG